MSTSNTKLYLKHFIMLQNKCFELFLFTKIMLIHIRGLYCFFLLSGTETRTVPTKQPLNVKLITLITEEGTILLPSIKKPIVNRAVTKADAVSKDV